MDWACAVIAAPSTIAPAKMDVIDGFISGFSFHAPSAAELNLASVNAQGMDEYRSH
jgi:hypothetical protein